MPDLDPIPDGFSPDEEPDILFNPKSRLRKEREAKERWRVENEIELERVRQERDNLQGQVDMYVRGRNQMIAGDNQKTERIDTLEKRLLEARKQYERLVYERNQSQESLKSTIGTPVRSIPVVKQLTAPKVDEKGNVSEKWWVRLLRWLRMVE